MTRKRFVLAISSAVLVTTGCSTLSPFGQKTTPQDPQAPLLSPYIITEPGAGASQGQSDYQPINNQTIGRLYASHKLLDDYVAELAMQLYQNSTAPLTDYRIAVAGFADLTPARDTLQPLGNALAERFLQQMPRYGVTMVDHKLTGGITLTAYGDTVFSNRAGRVAANQQIDYVLSGTVQHSRRGAQVNVRIMDLKSKTVLASASQLIPQFVLETAPFG